MTAVTERSALPDTRGEEQGAPWFSDVAALLAGGLPRPPVPQILARDDGVGLFYTGQVNQVFGDPESGKTWIAECAICEVLAAGGSALFVDLDHNGVSATVGRLLDLGADPDVLGNPQRFRYAEPEDEAHLRRVVDGCSTWRPAVVVLDSIGELLPLLRLSSNSPDDFTTAHSRALKPFAQRGAAVIVVDHLAKNPDSRSMGATGTTAKSRAIGGVSLRVSVKDAYAPGHGGASYLSVFKDRHGGLRAYCPAGSKEPAAGVFRLYQQGAALAWSITAPQANDTYRAAGVDDADIAELDALEPPPQSQRDVQQRMRWGGSRALNALNAWRALRSAPQEQGAGAPRSATPGVGSKEHQ